MNTPRKPDLTTETKTIDFEVRDSGRVRLNVTRAGADVQVPVPRIPPRPVYVCLLDMGPAGFLSVEVDLSGFKP